VLERAGDDLAEQVALVRLKMEESGDPGVVGVAYTGSVLERIDAVRGAMVKTLAANEVGVAVRETAVDSLDGAVWRARNGMKA
jgi:glucosamine kinase